MKLLNGIKKYYRMERNTSCLEEFQKKIYESCTSLSALLDYAKRREFGSIEQMNSFQIQRLKTLALEAKNFPNCSSDFQEKWSEVVDDFRKPSNFFDFTKCYEYFKKRFNFMRASPLYQQHDVDEFAAFVQDLEFFSKNVKRNMAIQPTIALSLGRVVVFAADHLQDEKFKDIEQYISIVHDSIQNYNYYLKMLFYLDQIDSYIKLSSYLINKSM